MMNETTIQVILSIVLAIGVLALTATIRRNRSDVFYASVSGMNGFCSLVFALGTAFVFGSIDNYRNPEPGGVGMLIFLWIFWTGLFLATAYFLWRRYEIKGTILIDKQLFAKDIRIDITKIGYIVYNTNSDMADTGSWYEIYMSDGGLYVISESMEAIDRMFIRMRKINDGIDFRFPIHHSGEGSFFDRFVEFGTFLSIPGYAVGFYLLLSRLLW